MSFCSRRFVFNRELRDLENYKNYHLFSDEFRSKTMVIYGANASRDRIEALEGIGIEAWK